MAISRLSAQDNTANPGTTSATITYPNPTTTGNLLVVVALENSVISAPAITGFTAITQGISSGASDLTVLYAISTGQTTLTITFGTGTTTSQYAAFEYTGNANPVSLDTSNTNTSGLTTGTSFVTASITTTLAADLIIEAIGTQGAMGGTTPGWTTSTNLATVPPRLLVGEYLPGAIKTSFTDMGQWTGGTARAASSIVLAFKAAVVAAGVSTEMLMGV